MRRIVCFGVLLFTLLSGTSIHGQDNSTHWTFPDLEVITPENISRIEYLGSLGDGSFPRPMWSPDSQTVIVGTTAGLWIYDLQNLSAPIYQPDLSHVLGFTTDGTAFFANNIFGETSLVDLETLQRAYPVPPPTNSLTPEPPPLGEWTTTSPDGRYQVNEIPPSPTQDDDKCYQCNITYEIVDTTSSSVVAEVVGIDRFSPFSYSMTPFVPRFVDSGFLYIKSDNTLWRWNPLTGQEELLIEHIEDNTISPDGHNIALYRLPSSPSIQSPFAIWDISGAEARVLVERTFAGFDAWGGFAIHPNGLEIAVGGSNNNIRHWNLSDLGQTFTEDNPPYEWGEEWVTNLAYSPDGKWLAGCQYGIGNWAICNLWDTTTDIKHASINISDNSATSLIFHPTEPFLVIGLTDGSLRSWEIDTLLANGENNDSTQPDRIFTGHGGAVFDLAFSTDGKILASASLDNTVRVWDWELGRLSYVNRDYRKSVGAVDISPNRQYLASASDDGTIRLWDFEAARYENAPEPLMAKIEDGQHTIDATGVAFSPDGRLVVGAYAADGIYIWDTATRIELAHFPQPKWTYYCCAAYPSVAFNPQGTLLIELVHNNGEILLWGVPK